MPQHILTLVGASLCLSIAAQASAQVFVRPASMTVTSRTSVSAARISGTVHDAAGDAVTGVSVLAVGATLVVAKSDDLGRFALALPPGEYVLRATREGYISTFREPIRVRASSRLERDITLVRQDPQGPQDPDATISSDAGAPADPNHAHTEIAWRLRHLKRSVLRNVSPAGVVTEADASDSRFDGRPSFLVETGLEGQVNLLASGSLEAADGWSAGRSSG